MKYNVGDCFNKKTRAQDTYYKITVIKEYFYIVDIITEDANNNYRVMSGMITDNYIDINCIPIGNIPFDNFIDELIDRLCDMK